MCVLCECCTALFSYLHTIYNTNTPCGNSSVCRAMMLGRWLMKSKIFDGLCACSDLEFGFNAHAHNKNHFWVIQRARQQDAPCTGHPHSYLHCAFLASAAAAVAVHISHCFVRSSSYLKWAMKKKTCYYKFQWCKKKQHSIMVCLVKVQNILYSICVCVCVFFILIL